MIEQAKNKGGRPPKGPKSGKGATLATRITAEMRQALDDEALRTGRSVSQVAELWLEEARQGRSRLEVAVGGYELVPAIMKLGEIAGEIDRSELESSYKWFAVRNAWSRAIDSLIPSGFDVQMSQAIGETQRLKHICAALILAIDSAGENDPVYQAALRPVRPSSEDVPGLIRQSVPTIAATISTADYREIGDPLALLASAGTTASAEIQAAQGSIAKIYALLKERDERRMEAMRIGQRIADRYAPPQPEVEALYAPILIK